MGYDGSGMKLQELLNKLALLTADELQRDFLVDLDIDATYLGTGTAKITANLRDNPPMQLVADFELRKVSQ